MHVAAADLAQVHDGGIAEAAVAVLDGGAADQNGVGQGLLAGLAGDIQNQVLVVGGFQLLHGVIQIGDVLSPNAQNNAILLGNLVHSLPVGGGSAVQNGLGVLHGSQSGLGALHIPALQNQVPAGSQRLLSQSGVSGGIGALVADENGLHIHPLADTLVVDLGHVGQLLVDLRLGHRGGDGHGVQVLVDQGLLMTEQDGLAAQLVILTEGNGLHSGGSGLVQHCLCVVREVGALINGNSALSHLHAECHTGGAAALLTVLLGRQLKNVQTFQSHDMYPPSA